MNVGMHLWKWVLIPLEICCVQTPYIYIHPFLFRFLAKYYKFCALTRSLIAIFRIRIHVKQFLTQPTYRQVWWTSVKAYKWFYTVLCKKTPEKWRNISYSDGKCWEYSVLKIILSFCLLGIYMAMQTEYCEEFVLIFIFHLVSWMMMIIYIRRV